VVSGPIVLLGCLGDYNYSMAKNNIIEERFSLIYGKPCWQVYSLMGSSIKLNFGKPYLRIQKLRTPKRPVSEKVREAVVRRKVTVRGEWHLWLSFCGWRYYQNEVEIGSSVSSNDLIQNVVKDIDGQILLNVQINTDGVTTFQFYLGGYLKTYPNNHPVDTRELMDCWTLFEPSGKSLTLRRDVMYCYKSSRALILPDDWLSVFPS
jgi:hypothetical protein